MRFSYTTKRYEVSDMASHTTRKKMALLAETTKVMESRNRLNNSPSRPTLYLPSYSFEYPIE